MFDNHGPDIHQDLFAVCRFHIQVRQLFPQRIVKDVKDSMAKTSQNYLNRLSRFGELLRAFE